MKTGNYTCLLCEKEFEPTKRGIQKFCSRKCGQKHNYHKNKTEKINTKSNTDTPPLKKKKKKKKEKAGVEKVTLAGTMQAALGTLTADVVKEGGKALFVPPGKRPATKNDITELKNLINTRYFRIENLDRRNDGALPHFDMSTRSLVYLEDPNYVNPSRFIP